MNLTETIENCYFDIMNQVAFVNKTWKPKMQKMIKRGISEARITWYYDYAIQRGKYRVYLKYQNSIFDCLNIEVTRKTMAYLSSIFQSFVNVNFIPYAKCND